MPIDAARLKHLIDARELEEAGRILPMASAADLAALPTRDLLQFVSSASDNLLQELRRRRPSTSEMAILLADRLMSAGLAEDAGEVILAALDATPNKGICLWRWISHLVGTGRLAEARAQLAQASSRYPGLIAAEAAAVDIDMAERNFAAAASRLERLARRSPALQTTIEGRIDRARTYAALARRFAAASPAPGAGPDYAAFAITLDEQAERFRSLQSQLAAARPALVRIAGVRGRYVPDAAAGCLAGPTAAAAKGTLGCFLSHVAAWERFHASGLPHGLFLEDDAGLAVDMPATIAAFDLPAGYDLCFASIGMEPEAPPAPTGALHFQPVAAAVATKPRHWDAPGTQGYFLSRRGAGMLLGLVARDGFAGDIDWRLVAYSLGKAACPRLAPDCQAVAMLRPHLDVIGACEPIAAWCLYPALFLPGRFGSVRKTDDLE